MSNIFQTVMGRIGSSIGAGVTSTLNTATSYLPSGAQSFLSSVGSFTGVTTQDIGDFVGDLVGGALTPSADPTKMSDLPQAPAIRGVGPSGAKQLARAGQA